ncbi:unnamed protein product [Trichogramma brassicae]|uniref:Uncharacterized protein n=1 Tax=Trichogramma brassicae TaxID=86971 RepID=A0A6H5IZB7_9HYME|nr:unnamed protein product [Trichogramma brassicae]
MMKASRWRGTKLKPKLKNAKFDSAFIKFDMAMQLDVRDKKDRTPLEMALLRGHTNLAESILRHGSDPNFVNSQGMTPLHVICKRKEDDYLLEKFYRICDELNLEVQVGARDKSGKTPLHYALADDVCKDHIVRQLLLRRADPHAVDAEGSTGLHVICRRKHDDDMTEIFFEILDDLQQTVQLIARDKLGRSPLEWAVANFQSKTVEELLRRGDDLSDFVFPCETYYDETFPSQRITDNDSKLKVACRVLVCLNWLTREGYELTSSDHLTIVKFFAKHELFLAPEDLPSLEEFALRAKNIKVKYGGSVYDCIATNPLRVAKLITIQNSLDYPPIPIEMCEMQLCEMISRRFFLNLALYPFWKLIHYRLPVEICEIILNTLMNKDILSVILAAINEGNYSILY